MIVVVSLSVSLADEGSVEVLLTVAEFVATPWLEAVTVIVTVASALTAGPANKSPLQLPERCASTFGPWPVDPSHRSSTRSRLQIMRGTEEE